MGKKAEYLTELNQVASQNDGMLRPPDVVDFAKNPTTALHAVFEWDDLVAGHNYRLQQARQLIRVVAVTLPGDNPLKYRAFVSMKEDRYNGDGYRAMVEVMTDGSRRERLLLEALEEMEAIRLKYANLEELAGVFEELSRVPKPKSKGVRKAKSARSPKYRRQQPAA